jgi:hypothetical protein
MTDWKSLSRFSSIGLAPTFIETPVFSQLD